MTMVSTVHALKIGILRQVTTKYSQFRKNHIRNMSASQFRIEGLCCAPCTPMKGDGSVNLDIIPKYVDHFVKFGVSNAFVTGTGGESLSLTVTERKSVMEVWLREAKGKLSASIIHIGAANLMDSKELAAHAEKHDAQAISAVAPSYFKPTTVDSYVDYMSQVASAAPKTPFYLYDIDFFTGVKFSANEFFDAAKGRIPTLCGVKHTSVDFNSIQKILANHPDMQILMGSNHMFLQGMALGINVTIGNSYFGPTLNRMITAYKKSDLKTARLEQERALKLVNTLGGNVSSIPGGLKAMTAILGLDCGQPRLPLEPFTDKQLENLKQDLGDIGYFDWGIPK